MTPLLTFWDLLELTLCHPQTLFEQLSEHWDDRYFWLGLILVACISTLHPMFDAADSGWALVLFSGILAALGGVISWLCVGGIVNLAAYAFTQRSAMKLFLTLSALATAPWFMLPASLLLKNTGNPALGVLGSLGQFGLWVWTIGLFILAFSAAYQLNWQRVAILLLMPILLFMVFSAWVIGFFVNLFRMV